MNLVPDEWTPRLAQAVASAVRDYHRSNLNDSTVVVFDLGCFPWHGRIELSLLTAADLEADPGLFDRSEIASWPHYDFTREWEIWRTEADEVVGRQMSALYHDTEDDTREVLVEAFLRASASAVATPEVTDALNTLIRDPRFQIWVLHPDTGRQFWPPEAVKG